MLSTPFSPWPCFDKEETEAVSAVLLSNKVNYWTGTQVREFEKEYAKYAEAKFAIAVSNGTVAIELALRALNIGSGDEVIVTPRSFLASVSTVINVGAKPVFADVDPDTQALSAKSIKPVLTEKTAAIIVVHLGGHPADMNEIIELANQHNIKIIEDCAQAHGARYDGKSVGKLGHIATWSFCQDKIISTGGEGGMITTDDEILWKSMWAYKDHGKSWDAVKSNNIGTGFKWLHESIGTNFRLTEMQAAIGRIQLSRLPEWHEKRLENANRIWNECSKHKWLRVPTISKIAEHAAYKAYVFVETEFLPDGWSREKVLYEINKLGVPAYSGSCSEIYLEKAFDGFDCRPVNPPETAKLLGETSLMFLVHPTLTASEIDKTCATINEVAKQMES